MKGGFTGAWYRSLPSIPVNESAAMTPRYRFLVSPRWIVGHVIVLALCLSMIWLGFWQLGRLDDKKRFRDDVGALLELAPVPIGDVSLTAADRYRPVSITGAFDPDSTVLVANRGFKGQSGYEILTVLRIADDLTAGGTAVDTQGNAERAGDAPVGSVVVDRGWIPLSGAVATLPEIPAPPEGTVVVTGFLDTFEDGSVTLDAGPPAVVTKTAVEHFTTTGAPALAPLVVQLTDLAPPLADGQPFPQEPPDISLGPHLSYAIQWFVFTAMLMTMWPLLIRRSRQLRDRGAGAPAAELPDPVGEPEHSRVPEHGRRA
jgi:cytochrome oxidase assembly protein ShyY1